MKRLEQREIDFPGKYIGSELAEIKSLIKPPALMITLGKAFLILIKDEKSNYSWTNFKKSISNPSAIKINADEVSEWALDEVGKIITKPDFSIERIRNISNSAVKMTKWIIAVY